jgi:hypothetical protein
VTDSEAPRTKSSGICEQEEETKATKASEPRTCTTKEILQARKDRTASLHHQNQVNYITITLLDGCNDDDDEVQRGVQRLFVGQCDATFRDNGGVLVLQPI